MLCLSPSPLSIRKEGDREFLTDLPLASRSPTMDAARDDASPSRRLTTVERAFELARSGSFRTIEDIGRQLKQEQRDSVDAHLSGGSIRKDLRQICAETRTARTGQPPTVAPPSLPA
jgi:hypothetical protein